MNQTSFALKGNIFFTPAPGQLAIYPESYLVCVEQKVAGVFAQLPEQYKPLRDVPQRRRESAQDPRPLQHAGCSSHR